MPGQWNDVFYFAGKQGQKSIISSPTCQPSKQIFFFFWWVTTWLFVCVLVVRPQNRPIRKKKKKKTFFEGGLVGLISDTEMESLGNKWSHIAVLIKMIFFGGVGGGVGEWGGGEERGNKTIYFYGIKQANDCVSCQTSPNNYLQNADK